MFPSPGSRVGRSAFSSPIDKCEIYLSTAVVTSGTGFIKVPMDAVTYDPAGLFDATRQVIVPRRPGYYSVTVRVRVSSTVVFSAFLGFNGSAIKGFGTDLGPIQTSANGGTVKVFCNGATDFLTAMINIGTSRTYTNGNFDTFMEVEGPF